jgi:hypothetical protein
VIQGGVDVTGGASAEDMDRDGGVISVYDADVNHRTITFEDGCDNVLVVPLRVDAMSAVMGFIIVRNKNGGPSKHGKHGLFDKQVTDFALFATESSHPPGHLAFESPSPCW